MVQVPVYIQLTGDTRGITVTVAGAVRLTPTVEHHHLLVQIWQSIKKLM